MSRPRKIGLDYFPVDTDIFDDFGIRILMSKFGADGFALYMYVLTRIYRDKGYYIEHTEDLELIASHDLGMSCEKVRQVLAYLFSRSLLVEVASTLVTPVTVITSTGIQRRYQEAVKVRASKNNVEVKAEFWLLKPEETESFIKVLPSLSNSEKNAGFSEKNGDKSEKNTTKKRKVNKSKGKENISISHGGAYFSDEGVNEAFKTYLTVRDEKLDGPQINTLIKKLAGLSTDPKEQAAIISEATIHKWKSFYALAKPRGNGRTEQKGSFYRFEQRQYDRELEAQLLKSQAGTPEAKEGAG